MFICGQLVSSTGQLVTGTCAVEAEAVVQDCFPRAAAPEFAELALVFGPVVYVLCFRVFL